MTAKHMIDISNYKPDDFTKWDELYHKMVINYIKKHEKEIYGLGITRIPQLDK